jgi:hypothetical protein
LSESSLWAYLRQGMKGRWHATRHEDKFNLGIPDVSYGLSGVNGWIELKAKFAWPKRAMSPVPVGLSKEQRRWILDRGDFGGNTWVLLRVRNEYLLFDWAVVDMLGVGSRAALMQACCGYWKKQINFDQLTKILSYDHGFWETPCSQS